MIEKQTHCSIACSFIDQAQQSARGGRPKFGISGVPILVKVGKPGIPGWYLVTDADAGFDTEPACVYDAKNDTEIMIPPSELTTYFQVGCEAEGEVDIAN